MIYTKVQYITIDTHPILPYHLAQFCDPIAKERKNNFLETFLVIVNHIITQVIGMRLNPQNDARRSAFHGGRAIFN